MTKIEQRVLRLQDETRPAMNNPYDVEQIRTLMRTMDAEREMNYIGYLSNEIDDKTLLLDLRIHVEQLRQIVTELQAASKAQDRCIRVVIVGTVFAFAMLVFTIRMFWM